MRIGTWNLAGRWSEHHQRFLVEQACDVWLLTEVNDQVEVRQMRGHMTEAEMAPGRRWAAVFSRSDLEPMADPHPASAMARIDGHVFVSSILPWRACGDRPPWHGQGHAAKTMKTVQRLASIRYTSVIWGGDWNHAMDGPEHAGSKGGRVHVLAAVEALRLVIPTATLEHRIPGLRTIDHIAVPRTTSIQTAQRVAAEHNGTWLSDHDAYIVTIDLVDQVKPDSATGGASQHA